MKVFLFTLTFCFGFAFSQEGINLRLDTLKVKEAKDIYADDYGNIYLYNDRIFSVTKYDSIGKEIGRLMMTVPFKIQSVQNPLNIVLFSENSQELKFVDQNLNEIQKIDLKPSFGFVKMAYTEDLQQAWILDQNLKRLAQYNFRDDKIINSFPLDLDFDGLRDMLVYQNKLFLLFNTKFLVLDFKGNKIFETVIQGATRLRRENHDVLVISNHQIFRFGFQNTYTLIVENPKSNIVDKNTSSYFVMSGNKVYLYPLNNASKK